MERESIPLAGHGWTSGEKGGSQGILNVSGGFA